MRVLPDTSVWVEYLRVGPPETREEMRRILHERSVWTCGPVIAEIVAGSSLQVEEDVRDTFSGLSWAPLRRDDWVKVGRVSRQLRLKGESLPLTDVTIAVAAVLADAAIWTHDRDFRRIRRVLPALELYQLGSS